MSDYFSMSAAAHLYETPVLVPISTSSGFEIMRNADDIMPVMTAFTPNADRDRIARACAAFNAIMAQAEAAAPLSAAE